MQNVKELRDKLIEAFNGVDDGSMTVAKAKELSNVAGKIINTIKCQLVYSALRKETPNIDFLNTGPKVPTQSIAAPPPSQKMHVVKR